MYIFTGPGLASCRRPPLSSNVRRHKEPPIHYIPRKGQIHHAPSQHTAFVPLEGNVPSNCSRSWPFSVASDHCVIRNYCWPKDGHSGAARGHSRTLDRRDSVPIANASTATLRTALESDLGRRIRATYVARHWTGRICIRNALRLPCGGRSHTHSHSVAVRV